MPNEIYLTPEELAERYRNRISIRTLANWRCEREGPAFFKAGGKVLYSLVDVLKWESSRKLGTIAAALTVPVLQRVVDFSDAVDFFVDWFI